MSNEAKPVLITGCSSGIGRETARRLAARDDMVVYATARKPESLAELEAAGCKALALDVSDESSMSTAVAAVEREHGYIWGLVNNAGYSQSGAVESVPLSSIREQFETNVFGLIRMCQLALPGMREKGNGRIVNIGSMGGTLTFPGGGVYHATKYAVEAISDAMRWELKGFGIDLVLIQPGLITTEFGATAADSLDAPASDGPYAEFNAGVGKMTADAYKGPMAKLGGGPEKVAAKIETALSSSRPRARYTVTPSAKLAMTQRKLLPDRLWDKAMETQFKRPS